MLRVPASYWRRSDRFVLRVQSGDAVAFGSVPFSRGHTICQDTICQDTICQDTICQDTICQDIVAEDVLGECFGRCPVSCFGCAWWPASSSRPVSGATRT